MRDEDKSKRQLAEEVRRLRARLAALRADRMNSANPFGSPQSAVGTRSTTNEVLDTLKVAICILDRNFHIVWINSAMEKFFGLNREDAIGKDKRELITQRRAELFENAEEISRRIFASYENNDYVEHFECHVLADGSREDRWLEHWSQPIRSGLCAGGRIEHYYDITEHKLNEKVLRASGHFLRTIISSVNEGIIVYDEKFRYQLWNEFMERLTGILSKEVLGKSPSDFFPHLEETGVLQMMSRALKGETVRSGDIPFMVPQTGKRGWVTGVYSPRIDSTGKIVGVVATVFDISDRRRAEQKLRDGEEKYRSIFNAAQDAIVIIDQETGNILDVNETANLMYGYNPGEMTRLSSFDISAEPEQSFLDMQEKINKIPSRYHQTKQGIVFPVEISASYYFKNGKRLITAVIRDITERKKAEKALETSQRRLRYLTSKLITAQEQEQKRISKELHDELGQSLLALKLQARSIEQKLGDRQHVLKEKCLEMLHYIDEVVENVHRLSRDLSPLILENLGLSAALRSLIEEFSKRTQVQSSVSIEDIEGIFPPASQTLIYRIFQECLTNIAKHAQASHVSLVIRQEGDFVTFRIEDDGRGFDPEKGSEEKGFCSGLGLTAMDERIRMLGGTINISSGANVGTKITFKVPKKDYWKSTENERV